MRRSLFILRVGLATCVAVVASGGLPAAPDAPAEFDVAWHRSGISGRFAVTLSPRQTPPPINVIHSWTVRVTDKDGARVEGARISVDGGMPEHGHGLPTRPRVTRELGQGSYLLEGVRFNMPGRWRLVVRVERDGQSDEATFDLPIETWDGDQLRQLRALWIGSAGNPPADPSNRWADDPRAARFGQDLFFDPGLSSDSRISCATCHQPERAFTDGRRRSRGLGVVERNAPTVVGVAWGSWFNWDGRHDSAWSQALSPIEDPLEMGATRLGVLRHIAREPVYRRTWNELFGPLPQLSDRARFPLDAGPRGNTEQRRRWEAMTPADRHAIDAAFANVGKALAAYERTLRPAPSRFDRYVEELLGGAAAVEALSDDEWTGLELLLTDRAPCLRCHNGPLFTNGGFHNIGLPPAGAPGDSGRALAVPLVLDDPFNCLGPHSDARPAQCAELRFAETGPETLAGAFKVPTLRNLAATAPYMHDGRFATLRQVLEFYNEPGQGGIGHQETFPLGLDEDELRGLEAFLRMLDAPAEPESGR